MRHALAIVLGAAFVLLQSSAVLADAPAAKGYVKEAEDLIEQKDWDGAKAKLELAETELDGVDAAAKAPINQSIQAAKGKIATAMGALNKEKYLRKLSHAMDEAEGSIGNLVTWPGAENEFNEVQANDEAKASIGPELEAAAKKFATFKKLHTKKASVQIAEMLETNVKRFEGEWVEAKAAIVGPDASPAGKEHAIETIDRSLADMRKQLDLLPPDDERLKPFKARIDKISDEFIQMALADRVKEVAATLQRKIELYKEEWDGYEKETAGPTWDQYQKEQSEKMSAFLAPKTRAYISRNNELLQQLATDQDYNSVKSDKSIKTIVDKLTAQRDAAYAKMLGFVRGVVEPAAKAGVKDPNDLSKLKDDVRVALGEKSPDTTALQDLLEKKMAANAAATTGAEEAKVKLVAMLRAKAEAEWPKLYEGMAYTTEIDLSNPEKLKGKNIGFLADNLMGYRFKPGDFYYATTIGGIPVAGKIDPQLMKQITATEKAIGRSLGDDDGDGKWDIIAVVTDQKTKLMAKRQAEATGKIEGLDVKLKGEYAEPVDAVVVQIIAAKCGPFAGAKDRGVVKEDGTVGK